MPATPPRTRVRPATSADVPFVVELIRELAEYEKLAHACRADVEQLGAHLFPPGPGARPAAECVIGELEGRAEGFALFFTTFSTFVCRPSIYLEDLYVRPGARGSGLGKALLASLARVAAERGCGRLEWSVLDWNEPAIGFYRSLGAVAMDEWTVFRLTGDALESLARTGGAE